MTPVSIVILSHNRLVELSKNLSLLLAGRLSPDEFEIIVVDNGSADGSTDWLTTVAHEHPEVTLVLNNDNRGVAGGRNCGYRVARRDFIVALDDDTNVSVDFLREVPALFAKYYRAGVLAFRVVHPISGELQNPHGPKACEVANHHGAGFALRRSLYVDLGGIDEECDYGAEEIEFAIRVRDCGMQVLYTPEVSVFHNSLDRESSTEKHRRVRRTYNNVRVYYKYFPPKMAARNSRRYTILAIHSWLAVFGPRGATRLLTAYRNGRRAGIAQHQAISDKAVAFYDNPELRPEFGNVSLWRKLAGRISRRRGRSPSVA